VAEDVVCTALDQEWGEDRPNILMHPPCACPRCAPPELLDSVEGSWLELPGTAQRYRVELAELGELGRQRLG